MTRSLSTLPLLFLLAGFIGFGSQAFAQEAPALSPGDSARQMAKSLSEGRLDQVFGMMPNSYQKDITGLAKTFGKKMDLDLWNQAIGMLKLGGKIFSEKSDILAQIDDVKNMAPPGEDVAAGFKATGKMINELVKSDMADLKKLQEGNISGILKNTGASIMDLMKTMPAPEGQPSPMEQMKLLTEAKIDVLSQEKDSATLKIEVDGNTQEVELSQVEGRWIPAEMAEEFPFMLNEMKNALEDLDLASPEFQQQKGMAMMVMGMGKQMMMQVDKAESKEDVERVIKNLGSMFGGGFN